MYTHSCYKLNLSSLKVSVGHFVAVWLFCFVSFCFILSKILFTRSSFVTDNIDPVKLLPLPNTGGEAFNLIIRFPQKQWLEPRLYYLVCALGLGFSKPQMPRT